MKNKEFNTLLAVFSGLTTALVAGYCQSYALMGLALLGFVQNIAFTFVSRGRNSGALWYHALASVFSNGIYLVVFAIGVDIMAHAREAWLPWAVVYVCSTVSGSIFAHWLAMRFERGKARNVQEDRIKSIEDRLAYVCRELSARPLR